MKIEVHQSGINTWFKCPKMFYYCNILKLPEAYSEALFLGSSVHYALNRFFTKHQSKDQLAVDLSHEIRTQENFLSDPRFKTGSYVELQSDVDDIVSLGSELLDIYSQNILDDYTVLGSEILLSKEVTPEITLAGVIDLLAFNKATQESLIIDFKVMGRRKSKVELLNDIQPTVYAYLVGGPIVFEYHALLKQANPDVERWRISRSMQDVDWLLANIVMPFARSIEAGIYVANCSDWWCQPKFCSYYEICKGGKSIDEYMEKFKA